MSTLERGGATGCLSSTMACYGITRYSLSTGLCGRYAAAMQRRLYNCAQPCAWVLAYPPLPADQASGTQVFGPSRINVHQLFESLRRQGELIMIGAETGVIENKWKRFVLDLLPDSVQLAGIWQP